MSSIGSGLVKLELFTGLSSFVSSGLEGLFSVAGWRDYDIYIQALRIL